MRRLLFILIFSSLSFGCKQNRIINYVAKPDQINKNASINESNNIQFIAFNGKVVDTIYQDSLTKTLIINDISFSQNNSYISYSINYIGKSVKGEFVNNFIGHFLASVDSKMLGLNSGDTLNLKNLQTKGNPFNLGASCMDQDDIIKFEKPIPFPDGKLRFYFSLPECSDYNEHLLIEKTNEGYEKLLSVISIDKKLLVNIINDSILSSKYSDENTPGYSKISYDYKNKREIK